MSQPARIDPMLHALRPDNRGFGPGGAGAPPPIPRYVPRALRDGEVELGRASNGDVVGLHLGKLVEGRLLIQGNSGAGKSMLLRRLFEQAFGKIQQVLVDPDGEFATLAEKFDVAVLDAETMLRVGGQALALHLRQHRYSAVLDLSDATSEQRLQLVAALATGLIEAPRELWHPLLVEVDEAQTLAPHYDTGEVDAETRKRAISSLADMMGRGRKRGVTGVIATQRLAETRTAVTAKAVNIVVGQTVMDIDQERAGALIGFTAGGARALRSLAAGEFLCLGPAFGGAARLRFKAGAVQSQHKGEAPVVSPPPELSAVAAADLLKLLPDLALQDDDETPRSRKRKNGLAWTAAEDQVIRDGYKAGLALSAISEQLAAIGRNVVVSFISTRAHQLGFKSAKAGAGWTDAEDVIIRDGYSRELRMMDTVKLLEESGFSRSRVSVQMRAITLGITRDRVNYWTEPESKIAIDGVNAGKSTREIIEDLRQAGFHRGITGITKFCQKHGIVRSVAAGWTGADIKKLRTIYEKQTPMQEMERVLGRTRGAIATMASKLGLKQRQPWTDAEKAILAKASAGGTKLADVPELLPGRTYATVAGMAARLRLDFSPKRTKKGKKK